MECVAKNRLDFRRSLGRVLFFPEKSFFVGQPCPQGFSLKKWVGRPTHFLFCFCFCFCFVFFMHSTKPKIRLWKKRERKNRESREKSGGQASTAVTFLHWLYFGNVFKRKKTLRKKKLALLA